MLVNWGHNWLHLNEHTYEMKKFPVSMGLEMLLYNDVRFRILRQLSDLHIVLI